MTEISFSGGTLERHIKKQKNELAAGTWPIIAEETCLVFVRDIFTALEFLYSKGLFHGDIKGNSFARNHLRLEVILYNLQIIFFIGSHLCLYKISLAMSYAWSHSPSDNGFQKISNNFEVVEEVDTFYSNHPKMKFV